MNYGSEICSHSGNERCCAYIRVFTWCYPYLEAYNFNRLYLYIYFQKEKSQDTTSDSAVPDARTTATSLFFYISRYYEFV